ncbi:MAG TPA: hypothetical protein VGI58_11160 [Streptosporangiaceae bacterium]|jgi:hypothetical protein
MLTAAALCPAPPLLARELTGAADVLPELREACAAAVSALVAAEPDRITVVGAAAASRRWPADGWLDLSAYAPGLGPAPLGLGERLPLPLGLGARLLDEAGYGGSRELFSVADGLAPSMCRAHGARLAGEANRVALLVLADGSARRGLKAPGYLDERSAPFDAAVERAIGSGDLAQLLDIDPGLAAELMAAGRPAWQVLAGAARELRPTSEIRYCDAPFGVAYLVASLAMAA